MTRMIQCAKLGKEAEGLDFPPLPGDEGVLFPSRVLNGLSTALLPRSTKRCMASRAPTVMR